MLLSFLLRLCLGFTVLVPSLAHAQLTGVLGIPGNGTTVSGVGMISGWKCEAGDITISLNDGDPIPATYGLPRADTSGVCDNDGNNGFFSYTNWGNLGDGEHTAAVYDDGVKFAESTFTVTTLGTEFLTGANAQVSVTDFPQAGETTTFEWNQATQHLEAVSRDPACRETLTMNPGETCRGSIPLKLDKSDLGEINTGFTFFVEAEGQVCIGISGIPVFNRCYSARSARLPELLNKIDISVITNPDGSWTIDDFPLVNLGECVIDLKVEPGAKCSGSIDLSVAELDFAFSVEADGEACIEAEVDLDLGVGVSLGGNEKIDACFDTREDFQKVLNKIGKLIDIPAFAAKNVDDSWTILDFL